MVHLYHAKKLREENNMDMSNDVTHSNVSLWDGLKDGCESLVDAWILRGFWWIMTGLVTCNGIM